MQKNTFLGTLLLHLSALFWGAGLIPQKYLVSQGFPLFFTIALRFVPIIFVILWKKPKISKTTLLYGGILGSFLFIGFLGQNIALDSQEASVVAFLISIGLVFIPIINYFLIKSKITRYNILAIVSVLLGSMMFNNINTLQNATFFNIGVFSAVIGSFGFTFRIVFSHFFIEKGESPFTLHIV